MVKSKKSVSMTNCLNNSGNDIIFTPRNLAQDMIQMANIQPNHKVLDPCRGGGVFYDNLPECNKEYCEIEEGKDFYNLDENKHFDLIIGNPPYSLIKPSKDGQRLGWLQQTIKHCDRFIYLIGLLNFNPKRFYELEEQGWGVQQLRIVRVRWYFGFSIIVDVAKKPTMNGLSFKPDQYLCDICNSTCQRGRKSAGCGPNECGRLKNKKNIE